MELDNIRRTWAEIDLSAVRNNFGEIKQHIGNSKLCCVVKADGYGHGAQMLAKLYESLGADALAVSNIDEAIEVRNCGVTLPLLILGYSPPNLAAALARYSITQVVFGLDYARELSQYCVRANVTVDINIKIDTGMSRIGFVCQSFPRDEASIDEILTACSLSNLNATGIMAHFAVSDDGEQGREFTEQQLNALRFTVDRLGSLGRTFKTIHHANSGAIEYYPESYLSMVRAGIILYGLAPSPEYSGKLKLVPAMTLKTRVAFVKTISPGATVSYGRTFTATKEMQIATVPVGYADGYFRSISREGYMLVRGKKAKILGRICMDQTIIDVTGIDGVREGDEVTVFGKGTDGAPTADDLALWADTINYEIICAVSKRVPRIYFEDSKIVDVMYKI